MNHDHHDDADSSRAHPTIAAPNCRFRSLGWTPRNGLAARGVNQATKSRLRRTAASVPAEPIREIVVIVVHPCQVLRLSFGRSSSKSVQYVQKSSVSSTEVTEKSFGQFSVTSVSSVVN